MVQRARRQLLARRAGSVVAGLAAAIGVAVPAAAQDTETISDADNARTVLLVVGVLVALGVLLIGVTVWFWRTTRPEHQALAPLEVMGDRRFASMSVWERRETLDSVRPDGAQVGYKAPPAPEVDPERVEVALDLQHLVNGTPTSFDDLRDSPTTLPLGVGVTPAVEPAAESGAEPADEPVAVTVAEPVVEPAEVPPTPSEAADR